MLSVHILEAFFSGDVAPLLTAMGGALFEGAQDAFNDVMHDLDPRNEFQKDLKDWVKNTFEDFMPGADELERIEKDVNQLLKDVESEAKDVFKPIADAVGSALGDGEIKPQGDGGLGKTAEDFTQGGNVPAPPMGEMPGISTDGAGTSRAGGGDGGGGSSGGGSGGGSGSSGGTTPLGGSGSGSGAGAGAGASGSGTGTQPPTAGDLGLDPNSNAYIEYQPNQGQVQISYPDGTTETRPWPPA